MIMDDKNNNNWVFIIYIVKTNISDTVYCKQILNQSVPKQFYTIRLNLALSVEFSDYVHHYKLSLLDLHNFT